MTWRGIENIQNIYDTYRIMPILQIHQLRVAAVAQYICEHMQKSNDGFIIDTDNIVTACLLHDMGNIIKFNLSYFPDTTKEKGLAYWQSVQKDFIETYGHDEHEASLSIAKELGVDNRVLELMDAIEFVKFEENEATEDYEVKVCAYADMRVSPFKVVSIQERMEDGAKRYANHKNKITDEMRIHKFELLNSIENQIFSRLNIKPEDINDTSVQDIIAELKKRNI